MSDSLIPPVGTLSPAERMFRVNWLAQLLRSPSGVPLHSPHFVALQGRAVRIVDLREPAELVGPLGHIPGADWIPRDRAPSLRERLERDEPVILVSRGGERASEAARALEASGMRLVAAMMGGIIAWKDLGYATTRDREVLSRKDVLRTLEHAAPAGALTLDDLQKHIGDPLSVRWVKAASLLLHGTLSCVDGRDDSGIVGTPGGDAGELLNALGAIERLGGCRLSDGAVDDLLTRRLDAFGRFYMHTDVNSLNALIAAMRADARLAKAVAGISEPLAWRKFLMSPPEDVREVILEHLQDPAHIGCGHVKLMLANPAEYGLRSDLVRAFLRAFFRMRWAGAIEAEIVPLAGLHAERAVVNVRVDGVAGEIWPFTSIPLVSPSCRGSQMFVNHPQVARFLRAQLAQFLCQQDDLFGKASLDTAQLLADIEQTAQSQLGSTLSRLAKGLPLYDVTFGRRGAVDIRASGIV